MTAPATRPGYFDALYAADPDPWRFETSDYEDAKYAASLAALPRPRYARALEIGCSIGVLTARLTARCDDLLAVDVAQAALERAAARCARLPQARFARAAFPDGVQEAGFDLLLLSEVLYYFTPEAMPRVAAAARAAAAPGADLLLVHWLGPTPDYPLSGDQAVAAFEGHIAPWAKLRRRERAPDYRLDLWRAD